MRKDQCERTSGTLRITKKLSAWLLGWMEGMKRCAVAFDLLLETLHVFSLVSFRGCVFFYSAGCGNGRLIRLLVMRNGPASPRCWHTCASKLSLQPDTAHTIPPCFFFNDNGTGRKYERGNGHVARGLFGLDADAGAADNRDVRFERLQSAGRWKGRM